MGYVPPQSPTALIRADLNPTLAHLYAVYESFGALSDPGPVGYRKYVEDLYGGRKEDRWFVFLNYAALAAFIALIIALMFI